MPRGALALALAVLAAGALLWFVPWATEERDAVVAAPSTRALFEGVAVVPLEPGERACVHQLAIEPAAEEVRFIPSTPGHPGPPLDVTLAAPGYRARAAVPGGYASDSTLEVPFAPPARSVLGRLCVENDGGSSVGLLGTTETRTLSRVTTTVEGEGVRPDVAVAFYRREERTILERLPLIFERMTAFRPGIVGKWLVWTLAALIVLGLPGLLLWSLRRASAERPRRAEDRDVVERRPDEPGVHA